jgi:hypothetical protein
MDTKNDNPSKRVVSQRIRNRIIEHLEVVASFDEQRQYQDRVPWVHVPNEVICGWGDSVHEHWLPTYTTPVYTADETAAILQFDSVLKSSLRELPHDLPELEVLFQDPIWQRLRDGASAALAVFRQRGKLSEEIEVAGQ